MFSYKICFVDRDNNKLNLREVGIEFPTKEEAVNYVKGPACLNDYEGIVLSILEVFVPEISN